MNITNHVSVGTNMAGAKFQLSRSPNAPISDAELLADLQRAAKAAGATSITKNLYPKYGEYAAVTVISRFGSWNQALQNAGLEVKKEVNIPNERLFENIMHLWEFYGRQPRREELGRPPSVFSRGPYDRCFGSWVGAHEMFVEYANSQDRTPPTPKEVASGHRTRRFPSLRLSYQIKKRDNFTCRACGASPARKLGLELHVDHIIAWNLGGETVEENLQTLCEACNLGKSNVL